VRHVLKNIIFLEQAMTAQEQEAYDLFRRAILHKEDDAWAAIHARYRAMLIAWALRYGAGACGAECAEDFADHALARAWMALTPDRFAEFPSLAKLLSYLRACVTTAVIDSLRAQDASAHASLESWAEIGATTEQIVLHDLDRKALWQMVLGFAATPAERIVLVETFAYGLPPRAILARHPEIFSTVDAVYGAKRNICARLYRHRDLIRQHGEVIGA
jgi:DNA-directed RNA polymerase specialized sigma24 family protein